MGRGHPRLPRLPRPVGVSGESQEGPETCPVSGSMRSSCRRKPGPHVVASDHRPQWVSRVSRS